MNKVISCSDLLLADSFKGWTQFDLVDLRNINAVNAVLSELGFDTNKPIFVYAANHRNMQGRVQVGYLFVGNLLPTRENINGAYATIHDTYAAYSETDEDFYKEIMALSTCSPSYSVDAALDDKIPERVDQEQRVEEQRILSEIKQLEEILKLARGDQRKDDGTIKCAEDYTNPPQPVEKKRRSKSKKIKEQIK